MTDVPQRHYFRTGEVAEYVGVDVWTIRHWCDRLGLKVRRVRSGQRLFTRSQVLFLIETRERVHDRGDQTLDGIKKQVAQNLHDANIARSAESMRGIVVEVVGLAENISSVGRDLIGRREEMTRVMAASLSSRERGAIFRGRRHMKIMLDEMRMLLKLIMEADDGRR